METQHASHCVIFYNKKYEDASYIPSDELDDTFTFLERSIEYAQASGYGLEQYQAACRFSAEDVAIRGY